MATNSNISNSRIKIWMNKIKIVEWSLNHRSDCKCWNNNYKALNAFRVWTFRKISKKSIGNIHIIYIEYVWNKFPRFEPGSILLTRSTIKEKPTNQCGEIMAEKAWLLCFPSDLFAVKFCWVNAIVDFFIDSIV